MWKFAAVGKKAAIVAGSAVFNAPDYAEAIKGIKESSKVAA